MKDGRELDVVDHTAAKLVVGRTRALVARRVILSALRSESMPAMSILSNRLPRVAIRRGMRNRKAIVIGELGVLAFAACGGAGDQGPAPVDAAAGPPQLAGVYTCSIEAIDARADCGGPVLTTDLSGQALTMTMSQTGTTLEAGMWGKILTGSVQTDGRVALLYRDITCTVCSGDRPFIIDFTGTAGTRQISNISVRMYQIVLGECEKAYQGTCATNR